MTATGLAWGLVAAITLVGLLAAVVMAWRRDWGTVRAILVTLATYLALVLVSADAAGILSVSAPAP